MPALEKRMKQTVIVMMILGGVLSRLIPHTPNVTAVTAVALLAGCYLSNRAMAALIPVLALWISDLFLGFHATMLFVYAAVALMALSSAYSLRNSFKWSKLIGVGFASSLFFFVVTNFGVWLMEPFYAKTFDGLITCYVMALPFLGSQVLGDLMYTVALFGAVQMLRTWSPAFSQSKI